MDVKFWGVVGSCPGRDMEMNKIASNTSCISVECGDKLIIFDAGSGIIQLSNDIENIERYSSIELFISHYHYDHIIGMPFASFFYNSNVIVNIYGADSEGKSVESSIKGLFVKPYLPMSFSALKADINFVSIDEMFIKEEEGYKITCMSSDHPGGNLVYRINSADKSFSYLTDLGHSDELNEKIINFSKESDLIYYDANFVDSELNGNVFEGWGHSTHEKGIKLLSDSNSKKIALGHHAMHRSANHLLELEKDYNNSDVFIAREGVVLKL